MKLVKLTLTRNQPNSDNCGYTHIALGRCSSTKNCRGCPILGPVQDIYMKTFHYSVGNYLVSYLGAKALREMILRQLEAI